MDTLMTNEPEKLFRRCADCGGTFYIKGKDQLFYASRNLDLPKRCFRCRKSNLETAERLAERGGADVAAQELPVMEKAAWEGVWTDKPATPPAAAAGGRRKA